MMKRRTRVDNTEDNYTIKTDSFDKRRFKHIFDSSQGFKQITEDLPSLEYLLGDMWASLYKMNPSLKEQEDIKSHVQANRSIMEQLIDSPEYEDEHHYTKLDELTSALGSLKFGEKTKQMMNEEANKNEEFKEKMDQLRQSVRKSGKDSKKSQKQSAALSEEIQKLFEQSKGKLAETMKNSIEEAKEVKDSLESLIGSHSNSSAEMKKIPLNDKLKLAETLSNNHKLKAVSDWAGRMKSIAQKKQKSKHSDSVDRSGVTTGNDVERLLPSELALFSHPNTKLDFMRRFAEGQVMQYEQAGKETLGKGPIIICLDQSGSMENLDEQSKGFALALMYIAKRQKRDFCYIPFASNATMTTYPKGKISVEEIIDISTSFMNTGTDFNRPLKLALEAVKTNRFKNADVIFITDGIATVREDILQSFLNEKEKKKFNLMSLLVGEGTSKNSVKSFSDEIIRISDFNDENSFKAFEI